MHPANARNKLIIITALITMFVTSLVWIGIGAAGFWMMTRDVPRFALDVEHPDVVEVGETFTAKVTVKNDSAEDMKLADLDVYESLLDGFSVVAVRPKPRTTERVFGIVTYGFSRGLKPAESFEVELELRAKEAGNWGGDIDACTPTQNFLTHYTEIEVIEPAVQ